MAAVEASEMARLTASVGRLERRIDELSAMLERQASTLDRLLELTQVDAASKEESSLHALLAELVARTGDNGALLRRIHRQLEQQDAGTGRPQP